MPDFKNVKTVYLVRHGQSEDNAAPVFQAPDSPLSEKGKAQAERIAERASRISFETLVASPFRRARETAEAIAKATDKEPEYSELFTERLKPARINGKTFEDEEAGALWKQWQRGFYEHGIKVEDGENFADLVARADRALAYLAARPEGSLMVVTHGYFLRTMIARILLGDGLTPELFRTFQQRSEMENTGITVLRYEGGEGTGEGWELWVHNDHAHLG